MPSTDSRTPSEPIEEGDFVRFSAMVGDSRFQADLTTSGYVKRVDGDAVYVVALDGQVFRTHVSRCTIICKQTRLDV